VLFDPIDLSGAVGTRKEQADVCGERADRSSCVLGALPIVWYGSAGARCGRCCCGGGYCGRGCSGHGRAEKISADVLMTGVYLGPSVPDALGDNGKHDLGPRNEIRGS
jgi:hypothetical protein